MYASVDGDLSLLLGCVVWECCLVSLFLFFLRYVTLLNYVMFQTITSENIYYCMLVIFFLCPSTVNLPINYLHIPWSPVSIRWKTEMWAKQKAHSEIGRARLITLRLFWWCCRFTSMKTGFNLYWLSKRLQLRILCKPVCSSNDPKFKS